MKECKGFIDMYDWLNKNGSDVERLWPGCAHGYINGHYFRMFEENAELVGGGYAARPYVCIDQNKVGSTWPAYYSIEEIEQWISNSNSKTTNTSGASTSTE